jgi:hypothetical protein
MDDSKKPRQIRNKIKPLWGDAGDEASYTSDLMRNRHARSLKIKFLGELFIILNW